MKHFHSFLASHLESFLQLKTKLGYTSYAENIRYIAQDFDHYLCFLGRTALNQIHEGDVLSWIHLRPQASAMTRNKKLRFARMFFDYLLRIGVAKKNPTLRFHPLKVKPHKPYIYTLQEISQILDEAKNFHLQHASPLLGPTLETCLFLIYACGLRIREALQLQIKDVDFEENLLSLWKTKFHKERLIPFSLAVAKKLKSYLALRAQMHPALPESPFFAHAKGAYRTHFLQIRFRQILVRCGLAKPKGRGAPRIHDLRHSFAVHRLYKWYQEGHNPLNKLPLLSTYMGHVAIENTQVYLTITTALLREGDRRFQAAFEEVAKKSLKRVQRTS
jgi:site-specific recombinase XerD